jgi:hypothetical protein
MVGIDSPYPLLPRQASARNHVQIYWLLDNTEICEAIAGGSGTNLVPPGAAQLALTT